MSGLTPKDFLEEASRNTLDARVHEKFGDHDAALNSVRLAQRALEHAATIINIGISEKEAKH